MAQITSEYIRLKKLANNPPQPPSGEVYFFAKSNGKISQLDDTNTETNMTGAAAALNDLSDFNITSETEGDYLKYDTGEWVNDTFPLVPAGIGDLTDVDTTGDSNYDQFMYTTSFKPKNQRACGYAYTTTAQSLSNNESNHLVLTNHANVTTGGDSVMFGTNYFQFLDDGGDLVHEGAHILESTFIFHSGFSGTATLTPVSIDGSTPTAPSGGALVDPYYIVTMDSFNDTYVHIYYVFFPPQTDAEFSWMIDNNINAGITYDYISTFRPFGHNTANTLRF
jgi:hypothetical protein